MRKKRFGLTVHLGDLWGPEGNAYVVLGRCQQVMKEADFSDEKIEAFMKEAKSGDYNHLLERVDAYFDHDQEDEFWEEF